MILSDETIEYYALSFVAENIYEETGITFEQYLEKRMEVGVMKKTVTGKWNNGLAVMYRIENIFLTYSADKDPYFKNGQQVTLEEVQNTEYYKHGQFKSIDETIPSDMSLDITFLYTK